MMILRCTAALLKKWDFGGEAKPRASTTATGDWFANTFKLGRKEYLLFASAKTLVSVVTRAAPHFSLPEFIPALYGAMLEAGIPEDKVKAEFERLSPIVLSKTNDRRVLGSMTDMIHLMEKAHAREAAYDPTSPEARRKLWDTPFKFLGDLIAPAPALRAAFGEETGLAPMRKPDVDLPAPEGGLFDKLPAPPPAKAPAPAAPATKGDTRFAVRALLQRAEAEEMTPPALLRALADASRDPGGDLSWIIGHDHDEEIVMGAVFLLFKATEEDMLTEAAFDRLAQGAAPVLERALRSADVADRRKAMIGTLMHRLGVPLDVDDFRSCFKDFEGATKELMDRGLKVDATPGSVTAAMEPVGELLSIDGDPIPADAEEWELAENLCARTAKENPSAAAMLLGTVCAAAVWHGLENHKGLAKAIRALVRHDSPEAMWQFGELASWPFGGALAKAAGQVYEEMLKRGLRPRAPFAPEFVKGLVSSNDGSGARQVGLFFKADVGDRDGVLLLCKDTWGLKDVITSYGDPSDLEMVFRHNPHEISHAPCTLELARSLFGDAVHTSLQTGKRLPPNAFLARQYLGEEPIAIEPRTPDLSAYKPVMSGHDPKIAADSAKLADAGIYGGLWYASDAAHDFVRKHQKRGGLPPAKFDQFVREVCVLEGVDLARRMAVNLEVEALAGRAKRKDNQMAARVWSAITGEAVSFADIPYVRELARTAVEMLGESIRQGYGSIAEANQAALDRDDELMRLLNPDAGPLDW